MSETRLKPILFNTEMVNAILDERKTVMRRIVKDAPDIQGLQPYIVPICKEPQGLIAPNGRVHHFKSPYQVGDILYVRETWGISDFDIDEQAVYIVYKAGDEKENCQKIVLPKDKFEHLYNNYSESDPDWHPSIHMPKEAARIFLRVTNVRVERLQDIPNEDMLRDFDICPEAVSIVGKDVLAELVWNATVKKFDIDKYDWAANPWVWVIEFNMINKEDER